MTKTALDGSRNYSGGSNTERSNIEHIWNLNILKVWFEWLHFWMAALSLYKNNRLKTELFG